MLQILKAIVQVLQLNEQKLLEMADLPSDFLLTDENLVTAQQIHAADIAIEQLSGRADLAHHLAMFRARTPRPRSTMAFAHCETVKSGIEKLASGKGLDDYTAISTSTLNECFRIEIKPRSSEIILLHWVLLCEIIYIVELCRNYSARKILPQAVGIVDAKRVRIEDIAFLGVTPFESKSAFIDFALCDVSLPLLTGSNNYSELKSDYSAQSMPKPTIEKVKNVLMEILPSGLFGIEHVSCRLNMNVRKLQRQLEAEGSSFRSVLASTRKELAIRYLKEEQRSVAEVSQLVGYQDQNSFYRAFKVWTGKTTSNSRLN